MKKYVIVGNGIAAAGCIEGIRSVDPEGTITVVSKEAYPVYCRPLISYYLEGVTDPMKMNYRPQNFYEDNGCEVLYEAEAASLDRNKKQVVLSDGKVLDFDAVCIASGSSPFVPPMEGLDLVSKKCSFLTLDDALELEGMITRNSNVLIIGAGLIGLKCAEGLHGNVGSITVCDLAPHVLSSILDEETAVLVEDHLRKSGIELLLADTAARFEDGRAFMKSGKEVDFDVLVTAVGVRANSALAADAGGTVNRGIVVDTHMKTDLADVYAAGDCAEGYDLSLGDKRVLALFGNAYRQGFTAGVNMAGGDETFENAIPMNSMGLLGLHIMTAGTYVKEEDGGEVHVEKDGRRVKKFFVKDGLLKGYIFINQPDRGGIYTALIREQTPLESVDFDLLKQDASFMAFSVEKRRKMFGGAV